ncbi:MAG TPA: zf-HC2 domain-containing protein, partial [Terriglobales bacterium]|nr:zf-HC2 domain-containing protein [Terriglobales bacterium]
MKKIVSAGLRSKASGLHPDADSLSAFAERALSQSEQSQVLAHLARCDDCRQVFYLAAPESAELQKIMAVHSRRSPQFLLRWGTLAATVAVCAVLFVGTQRHGLVSFYKEKTPPKPATTTAAELNTPRILDEMHASRDDRASTRDGIRQPENKIIPTPKHMTAKPTGKFDFDQSDQVRMSPVPTAPPAIPALQGRTELGKSAAATPGPVPATAGAIGGSLQNNQLYSSTS